TRRSPGCGPGAGRFRLLVATGITVALRVARRTRRTPGRVPGSAAGRCPEPGQRIADVRSISAPQYRTDAGRLVTGTHCARADPQTRGHGPGVVRVRVTSPHATVEARTASPPGHYRPGAM